MEIIFGLIAIFFAVKNILGWLNGKDPSRDRFLSMAFTCIAIFGFYNMGANFLEKGDIAGALENFSTIPSIGITKDTRINIIVPIMLKRT